MAKHKYSRSSRKGPKNQVWTTVLREDDIILSAATQSSDIVTTSDWSAVGGLERATVMRVRGWLSCSFKPTTGSFGGAGVFCYMSTFDDSETSPSGSVVQTYSEEDILGTWGWHSPFIDTGTAPTSWIQTIDVKAMRKIKTGKELRFVITNEGAAILHVSLVLRALVRRGGN